MNKSKEAEDQRLIDRFVQYLQTALTVCDHETGNGPVDRIVKHDGYTFSLPFGGKRIYFKCSVS